MYVFSAYSTQLADRLHLTATQSALVGMMGTLGVSLLGSIAGIITDRFGPSVPVFAGALCLFAGYATLYTAYVHSISVIALLAFGSCLSGFGSTLAYSASIKTAALNLPAARGTAVAFPLAAFGLSAVFFTTIASLLFPNDTAGFLALLAVLTSALCLINLPFLKFPPQHQHHASTTVGDSQTAGYVAIIEDDATTSGDSSYEPTLPGSSNSSNAPTKPMHPTATDIDPAFETDSDNDEEDNIKIRQLHEHDLHHSFTVWEMFATVEFWAQFWVLGLLAGVGQMYIYCCGYIVRALVIYDNIVSGSGQSPDGAEVARSIQSIQALQVALISISSFVGRLISGTVSDLLSQRLRVQRLWMVCIATGVSLLANLSMISFVTNAWHLWLVSLSVGTAYGLMFGVFPTIVCDTFGIQHFSKNWGFVAISPVFTIFVFNRLFGTVYDHNSVADGYSLLLSSTDVVAQGTLVCLKGAGCYSRAFAITSFVSLCTLVLIAWMIYTEKHQPTLKQDVIDNRHRGWEQHQQLYTPDRTEDPAEPGQTV
ncbi:hypothetical protein D0Z00_000481 [Geotrichum galactomycetum]|uniref:Uncharacterized protein n=1 Tax=Geotrichum galactomycetum TaxID=27317 RepID=A0ACB6V9T9_9ASCO|nr:hypothetical protein D0Z00_000481 [Geotrichum candidum]